MIKIIDNSVLFQYKGYYIVVDTSSWRNAEAFIINALPDAGKTIYHLSVPQPYLGLETLDILKKKIDKLIGKNYMEEEMKNAYRFIPSLDPGIYLVIDNLTNKSVEGFIAINKQFLEDSLRVVRESDNLTISALTVDELSHMLDVMLKGT